MEWAFLSEYELAQKEEQELSCKLAVDQELDKIQRSLLVIQQKDKQQAVEISSVNEECYEDIVRTAVSNNHSQIQEIQALLSSL